MTRATGRARSSAPHVVTFLLGFLLPLVARGAAADTPVSFEQSAAEVSAYDFVEIAIRVAKPTAKNPFSDVTVTGEFQHEAGPPWKVEGFCDALDGTVYRIRFLPTKPGRYTYRVEFRQGQARQEHRGAFTATDGHRRGLLRVVKEFPWHFTWEGTREFFFWNATTTYWLLGWEDEAVIQQAVERLDRLKVNRLRVALCGRTPGGERWDEPLVTNTKQFKFRLNPWLAARPDSVRDPGFDVTRFNVPFWQKCERLLQQTRDKDMIVSIIFYLDGKDPGVDPFGKERMGCEDEQRYYRYAVARLAAFSNVTWDVTNEYHLFRNEAWTDQMGTLLKSVDPYQHLTSVHGHGDFRFRQSPWADFAMYQSWDEAGGYEFMLEQRAAQAATGRPMPQVNEEYGYEDHYPTRWGGGRKAPARSADNRRRLAWEMYMAGGFQTTGERADRGTGRGPDSGGGWLNGRGDDSMTMLAGYGFIVDFFTAIPFWQLHPAADLIDSSRATAAAPPGHKSPRPIVAARNDEGDLAVIYFPQGGEVKLKPNVLRDGLGRQWFNPRDGSVQAAPPISPRTYRTPDANDWALMFSTRCSCAVTEPKE